MKKTQWIYLILGWLLIAGCKEDDNNYIAQPIVDISDIEVVVAASGKTSENTIITSNVDWTLKGGNEWCTVSPENGQAGTTMVYFTLSDNEDYEDRNMHVTLEAGDRKTLITVIQKKKDALTITKDKFDIPREGDIIEINVNTNIDYQVKIPTSSASWITPTEKPGTKALSAHTLYFKVAENTEGNKRDGQVIIEDEIRRFSDTVRIYQVQKDMIVLTRNEYKIPLEGLTIDVELKTNVDYEIRIPEQSQDWIHLQTNRSLRTDVVKLKIDAVTDDTEYREAEIIFKDRNSNLQEKVTIIQVPKESVIVTPETTEVPQAGGKAEYSVLTNVEYEVIIPSRIDWVKRISSRSMREEKLIFQVDPNPLDQLERTVKIIVKGKGEEVLSDTVYIHQAGRERMGEEQIVYNIYNALNGKAWTYSNWMKEGVPYTQWSGIKVNAEGKIIELSLTNTNIKGQIPPEIADLKYLTKLTISKFENITGNIPEEFGNLSNLKTLSLSGQFETIPEELWQLEQLEELSLTTIATNSPAFIGELENLKKLTLQCNYAGPIPPEFGNLTQLTYLSLGSSMNSCKFTSIPAEIGRLTSLTSLNIYSNLQGVMPPEIGNLAELTSMTITKSQLSSIPDEIGKLKKLTQCNLQDNKITAIPAGIGGMESLTQLNLSNNVLSGSIPSEIGNLKKLSTLYLNNNTLTGEIPTTMGSMENLSTIYLNTNKLNGNIPYEMGNMKKLGSIYLQENQLTGNIPSILFKLPNLSRINLSDNRLTGSLPGEIISAKDKLKYIYIANNRLSGDLPQELVSMQLSDLDLENNNITGEIPKNILNTNFKTSNSKFILNGNRLSGEIPEAVLIKLKDPKPNPNWKITEQQAGYGFTNWP